MIQLDRTKRRLFAFLLATGLVLLPIGFFARVSPAQSDAAKSQRALAPLPWLDSLSKASLEAQQNHRPILVRVRGDGCAFCERLEAEMAKPQIRELLKQWTLVTLDVDRSPAEAQRLGVEGIPALRVLSPFGGTIGAHDGFLPAAELATWLKDQAQAAHTDRIDALLEEGEPDAAAVSKLVDEFQERDPLRREAAMRRLRAYPQTAVLAVSQALQKPSLSTRLVAIDLLREWHAPVVGLDPWRSETLNRDRLKRISDWAAKAQFPKAEATAARPLSPAELAAAQAAMEKLVTAPPADVAALREQLARFGRGLLPVVYGRLKESDTDAGRERLVALRYRLVASDRLPLRWPGGLERLASMNLETRRSAVDELSHLAKPEDESLLLEIFSDPAPIVREIALRSLWTVGSSGVSQSLTRLLDDPDSNVRAAVLKQLGEKPTFAVSKFVAIYAKSEKDADLVAHAVRVVREVKRKETVDLLKPFLVHPSWRVRAEATEGIGKLLGNQGVIMRYNRRPEDAEFITSGYGALVPLLKDPDPFVVSRALEALAESDLATLVDPIFQVAKSHPEMTVTVVQAFGQGSEWGPQVLPRLFEFCRSSDPTVRAASIEALGRRRAAGIYDALEKLLVDRDQTVRIAALKAFFQAFTAGHPRISRVPNVEVEEVTVETAPPRGTGLLDLVGNALAGLTRRPAAPARKPVVAARPAGAGTSGSSAEDPNADPLDQTLREIRAAKRLSKQTKHIIEIIEPLTRSQAAAEKLAAACALAAAGHDAVAVPILREAASDPGNSAELAETLPWLLWNDRKDLFERLRAVADDGYRQIINDFAIEDDLRAPELLWTAAAADRMTGAKADSIFDGLQKCYFGRNQYQLQSVPKTQLDQLTAASIAAARSPKRFERLIALALLLVADKDSAAEMAQSVVDDQKQALPDRIDALKILLAAKNRTQAQSSAVKMLSSPQAELCEAALSFLANPEQQLSLADGGFIIYSYVYRRNLQQPDQSKVDLPADLKPEALTPWLRSSREKVAAYAGYFLCMLDHAEGLPPLLRYWDAHGTQDAQVSRLVYRAIAELNSESHVPLLARIYQQFHNPDPDESHAGSDFSVKDFYWTIRSMTGPQVLALRKKIREEVGVASLSQ